MLRPRRAGGPAVRWARRNLFLQPLLERTLRAGVTRFAQIDTRFDHELVSLLPGATSGEPVVATVRGPQGRTIEICARFVVGADGGRSTVRDLLGVALEGTTEPVKWLVVDVADDALDAPYSAVYCDPDSPVLMVPLPYRHRRFEFRLHDGEDETAAVHPDHVRRLLESRYGSVSLPEVVRARVYLHHSRVAATFRVGAVVLAGDAAHLQPPFFGQGMNSGLRDATNLAWKLAAIVRGQAEPDVLATYDSERRPHATAMVRFATKMGAMYRPQQRSYRAVPRPRVPGGPGRTRRQRLRVADEVQADAPLRPRRSGANRPEAPRRPGGAHVPAARRRRGHRPDAPRRPRSDRGSQCCAWEEIR